MFQHSPAPVFQMTLLTSVLAVAIAGCSESALIKQASQRTQSTQLQSGATQPQGIPQPSDSYALAIDRASSAYTIGQSARSQDDWRLVADRWQQAVDLMAAVPGASPHHPIAAQKLLDYQRNLTFARKQANLPETPVLTVADRQPKPSGFAKSPQPSNPVATSVAAPAPITTPPVTPIPAPAITTLPPGQIIGAQAGRRVFHVPIVRRAGNTPVIAVMFNGTQSYEMIVDTGASGTLITQPMATALRLKTVGQTSVDTASAQAVSFPLGHVTSMEAGGAMVNDVMVAIAGPELTLGLLGHDFFGHYDIILRENEVLFQER
ncbi:MAG: retroviral-like aspartic protease family protein [Oculatellaceae cyanobacterium Prado106]|jgi:predicted aspartyl protease|nr:retroviral-like aspartic protease family protein [Oculatellaceae cyanobacterium Prado106]